MPTIELSQGQRARVDWQDYKRLVEINWYAVWAKSTKSFYAQGHAPMVNGKRPTLAMAREVLGLKTGDGLEVDHKNHDTLDNRRRNLRIVDRRGNAENRRKQSRYGVGVHRLPGNLRKPFQVCVCLNGKQKHVGMFATPEEAQKARREFLEHLE